MKQPTREDLLKTAAEHGAEPADVEAVLAGQRVADAAAYRAAEVLRGRAGPPIITSRRPGRFTRAAGPRELGAIAAGASRVLAALTEPR